MANIFDGDCPADVYRRDLAVLWIGNWARWVGSAASLRRTCRDGLTHLSQAADV